MVALIKQNHGAAIRPRRTDIAKVPGSRPTVNVREWVRIETFLVLQHC